MLRRLYDYVIILCLSLRVVTMPLSARLWHFRDPYMPPSNEGMCAAVSQAIGRVSNACDLNIPEVAVTLAILVRLLAHCP